MSLKDITKALKQLGRTRVLPVSDDSSISSKSDGNASTSSDDGANTSSCSDDVAYTSCSDDDSTSCSEYSYSDDSESSNIEKHYSHKKGKKKKGERGSEKLHFFCYEDALASKDVSIEVENIGQINFPLDKDCIENMIKLSSKAKFGSGEETVLDTNVRDTQTIPADKLKVTINAEALTCILERIGSGLNIDKDCTIEPSLHNLLIYGPGQFFKKHRDSEKLPNMIATLVIVLPSKFKGGDLIIEHNKKAHVFFGSQNFDLIKCVAFYSDCEHEIKEVTDGYRVALTYNIILKSSKINNVIAINESLEKSVAQYFAKSDNPEKLIFLLNHRYSKHSLKWGMLKGTDRTHAYALLAIAKKQNLIPYLTLADYQETKDSSEYSESGYKYWKSENDEVYESFTTLHHYVDEHNNIADEFISSKRLNDYVPVADDEICYTIKTKNLCKPFKKEESGPTGNEGATCDYWYRRACVVLFANKWIFIGDYKSVINELYQLTMVEGNEKRLLEEIDNAGCNFLSSVFWRESCIAEMVLKIVIYLKNSEKAVLILSHMGNQLLCDKMIELLLQLESQYDAETWGKILQNWTKEDIKSSVSFIKKYKDLSTNRYVLEFLLDGGIKRLMSLSDSISVLFKYYSQIGSKVDMKKLQHKEVYELLLICMNAGYEVGEKKLIEHIRSIYTAAELSEIFFWLDDSLEPYNFIRLKEFKDDILKRVQEELSKLPGDDDWSVPIAINCDCEICNQVNTFFKSATSSRFVLKIKQKHRRHVMKLRNSIKSNLMKLEDKQGKLIKLEEIKEGSSHKMVFEKLPEVLINKQKKILEFTKLLDKLKNVNFVAPVLVQPEEVFPSSAIRMQEIVEHSRLEMQPTIKTESSESCANIEADFENNIEEQVSIKSDLLLKK